MIHRRMKAVHGGKTKNDRIDAEKIAILLRGGMLPQAYAYPPEMRPTRDLLRRRSRLVRMRAELLGHVQLTRHQYNLAPFKRKLAYRAGRKDVGSFFTDTVVRQSVDVDTRGHRSPGGNNPRASRPTWSGARRCTTGRRFID
jgi:hypothetical protein